MSVPPQLGETPLTSPIKPPELHQPSSADVDLILQNYFQKKGYHPNELAYIREHNLISLEQLSKQLKNNQDNDYIKVVQDYENGHIDAIEQSYASLIEWVDNALDLYKNELRSVLYPLFIHVYFGFLQKNLSDHALHFFNKYTDEFEPDHHDDLSSIGSLKTSSDLKSNSVAQLYQKNKYNLRLSSIPFELFLGFIEDNKYSVLHRIIHQHLHIHLITGKLQPVSAGGSNEGIAKPHKEHEQDEADDSDTLQAKIKKEPMDIDDNDMMNVDSTGDCIPNIPYRGTDIQAELESLSELRKRVAMGSTAPPSICLYTFHNTHDLMNCIGISEDATLVAAGFAESHIKIWHLKGKHLKSKSERENGEEGSIYKKLIGHAGPVYSISFSHDNQYLISCSEDKTVRLWNLDTFENVVCYRNHNYPVWDVDFGPYGFYFATASHDRTARLWTCDRMHPLRIFAGHLSDVNTVRFHPNSKYIVTGSNDKTARLWDVQRGTCVRIFTGHTGSVDTVAISPNGRLMASAGGDTTILLWDLATGKQLKTMTGHTAVIYSVSFNSDSTVLVSGSADGTARVWDVNKNTPFEINHENEHNNNSNSNNKIDNKRGRYDNNKHTPKKDKKHDKEKNSTNKSSNTPTNTTNTDTKRKKGESNDQLGVFPTKNTPIYTVQFTKRNLCLAAGTRTPIVNDLLNDYITHPV